MRLDAEERSRLSRIRESRLRQSQDSMLADAEQWRRLFDTGVTSDSPEVQRLAAQIMDKNIKAAKAQVPQDAEEQAAMPLPDTLGVVRSANPTTRSSANAISTTWLGSAAWPRVSLSANAGVIASTMSCGICP